MKLAIALVVLLAGPALADVVELKTGQRVEGTLTQADQASVSVEVGGQVVTFKTEQVKAMYFGSAPPASPPSPTPRDEALRSLQALRSVAEGGIAYRDYAPRVSDAKIVVDRYLSIGGADAVSGSVKLTMEYYVLASSAWNARLTDRNQTADSISLLGMSPLIGKCEMLKRFTSVPVRPGNTREYQTGVDLMFGVSEIWSCASAQLAEAEKLLEAKK